MVCSCGKCLHGALSPRMACRLQRTAPGCSDMIIESIGWPGVRPHGRAPCAGPLPPALVLACPLARCRRRRNCPLIRVAIWVALMALYRQSDVVLQPTACCCFTSPLCGGRTITAQHDHGGLRLAPTPCAWLCPPPISACRRGAGARPRGVHARLCAAGAADRGGLLAGRGVACASWNQPQGPAWPDLLTGLGMARMPPGTCHPTHGCHTRQPLPAHPTATRAGHAAVCGGLCQLHGGGWVPGQPGPAAQTAPAGSDAEHRARAGQGVSCSSCLVLAHRLVAGVGLPVGWGALFAGDWH